MRSSSRAGAAEAHTRSRLATTVSQQMVHTAPSLPRRATYAPKTLPSKEQSFTITISLSIKYSDIKTQNISPERKLKIQLQLVLHSGRSARVNRDPFRESGVRKALRLSHRNDMIKERLSTDMIEKQKILHENPESAVQSHVNEMFRITAPLTNNSGKWR